MGRLQSRRGLVLAQSMRRNNLASPLQCGPPSTTPTDAGFIESIETTNVESVAMPTPLTGSPSAASNIEGLGTLLPGSNRVKTVETTVVEARILSTRPNDYTHPTSNVQGLHHVQILLSNSTETQRLNQSSVLKATEHEPWAHNPEKPCLFMELSFEIRERIYEYAMDDLPKTKLIPNSHIPAPLGRCPTTGHKQAYIPPFLPALCYLNWKILLESSTVYLRLTHLSISREPGFALLGTLLDIGGHSQDRLRRSIRTLTFEEHLTNRSTYSSKIGPAIWNAPRLVTACPLLQSVTFELGTFAFNSYNGIINMGPSYMPLAEIIQRANRGMQDSLLTHPTLTKIEYLLYGPLPMIRGKQIGYFDAYCTEFNARMLEEGLGWKATISSNWNYDKRVLSAKRKPHACTEVRSSATGEERNRLRGDMGRSVWMACREETEWQRRYNNDINRSRVCVEVLLERVVERRRMRKESE